MRNFTKLTKCFLAPEEEPKIGKTGRRGEIAAAPPVRFCNFITPFVAHGGINNPPASLCSAPSLTQGGQGGHFTNSPVAASWKATKKPSSSE